MTRRIALAAVVAAALLGAAGCGAPDKLEDGDDRELAAAREGLDEALATEEAIRTSPEMGRRLATRVARAGGNAGAVERLVPSLVVDGEVDAEATEEFVRNAASDAPRALLVPAQRSVDSMTDVIDDSGADGDTEVPHAGDRPLAEYLDTVRRDIEDVWPTLANDLEEAL